MFLKRKFKRAFNYWQNKSFTHPLTCGNSCGNLEFDFVDNNHIHLYCKKCDYKQTLNNELNDMVLNNYNQALQDSKIIIRPFFRWYDLWIGIFIDTKNDATYIIPFPMFGIKIQRKFKNPFDELFDR
jgi:hypothetical protein